MVSLHQLPVCPIGGRKSGDGDGNAAPDQFTLMPLALMGAARFA